MFYAIYLNKLHLGTCHEGNAPISWMPTAVKQERGRRRRVHAIIQSECKILFQRIAMMMDTLKLAFLLMIFGVHLDAFSRGIKTYFAIVNTPYTFPGNGSSCDRAEWRKSSPTDTTIATYQNKICRIEKDFREEFSCKEKHLLLNSAKYADSGPYEFVCNGDKKPLILDVLYAVNVDTAEMDNITLSCHAANANDVTWLHKDEKVLHYKKDGTIIPGKGYEGRVSLEKNCLKTGDLSLTITGVCKTDAGLYQCFVNDETTKGDPQACLLHVKEKRSSPGNQTDSNCNEAQIPIIYKTATIILGTLLGFLILVAVIYLLYCLTSKLPKYQSTSATTTYERQSVDSNPVQESNTTENKSSNTRPFFNLSERGL
ncbi:uncharacterized protein LOC125243156 isoform X2 [Megalobrama amblycephala]|uniref:uncharacterized protein LOC125243156 isoform X2 n=1 Tax=Megalobrama amblycephala TaxID=75352 RepID=UPI00201465FC|nr:uncharacterized protein LOC125243156 isoform X2 [Megalobrama amblycephala]